MVFSADSSAKDNPGIVGSVFVRESDY